MSAVAGWVRWDGAPVPPDSIQAMLQSMPYRAPHGMGLWCSGSVALGHGMLQATPESLAETQPWANENETIVVVMDGRVDNRDDLRRKLRGHSAQLRNGTDVELVLRAYEVWGDACAQHIIGECVFFVWDVRQRRLYAARDVAGTRHFYYHHGTQGFGFASEIRALLTQPAVQRTLNEKRLLDFFTDEYDCIDEVGTVYQDILRLPAGHCLSVDERGLRIWRYWRADAVQELRFSSRQECVEAFREQLKVAIESRLRHVRPVAAMLSGGLDSSAVVGVISKDLRHRLTQPLRTYSMANEDTAHCPDALSVASIVKADPWLASTLLTSKDVDAVAGDFPGRVRDADDPFDALHGWAYDLIHRAAAQDGCGTLFDGMAGDALFYSPSATLIALMSHGQYFRALSVLRGLKELGWPAGELMRNMASHQFGGLVPQFVMEHLRRRQAERSVRVGSQRLIREDKSLPLIRGYRTSVLEQARVLRDQGERVRHAYRFHTGLLAHSHEIRSNAIARYGMEYRSPFSDRRMIEFAVALPFGYKLADPWYKSLLREMSVDCLPSEVVWRRRVGYHPGASFFARLADALRGESGAGPLQDRVRHQMLGLLKLDAIQPLTGGADRPALTAEILPFLKTYVTARWLE